MMNRDDGVMHEPRCVSDMAKKMFPLHKREQEEVRLSSTEESTREGDF